jgi:exopolysaccharide biosynthesis WecB/TagA/CpsF family protein
MTLAIESGDEALTVRDILGVAVAGGRGATAVRAIDRAVASGRWPVRLAWLNAHGANLAARDREFRAALARCTVLNDGVGVNIAAGLLTGRRFPENLNGTDFVPRYLDETEHAYRLFLLGAKPGVAERAGAAFLARAGRHAVVGARHGYFTQADIGSVVAEIRASEADMLLVALGNPAQEIFLARHAEAAGVRLAVAVGGLFDFASGDMPRAPALLRRAGLEWTFRLAMEPKRMWRRYVVGNPEFLARVAVARLGGRGR